MADLHRLPCRGLDRRERDDGQAHPGGMRFSGKGRAFPIVTPFGMPPLTKNRLSNSKMAA